MTKAFNFSRCLRLGQAGAEWVARVLESVGLGPVSLTENEQQRGVDGECAALGKIEIKADFHTNLPNVFLEISVSGQPGCIFTSRADYLVYAFPLEGLIYIFSLPAIQWWLARNLAALTKAGRIKVIHSRNHTREWTAEGVPVPRDELLRELGGQRIESDIEFTEEVNNE